MARQLVFITSDRLDAEVVQRSKVDLCDGFVGAGQKPIDERAEGILRDDDLVD